jgi:hypothetical protein
MKARLITWAAAGALAAGITAVAAPALAQSYPAGPVPASVTVGSVISLAVSATSLNYGSATLGAAQLPQAGSGVAANGTFTITLTSNDPDGWALTGSAPDFTSGPASFPASSLASTQITNGVGSFPAAAPFSESGGQASGNIGSSAGMGTYSISEELYLTVPSATPVEADPFTSAVTFTGIAN